MVGLEARLPGQAMNWKRKLQVTGPTLNEKRSQPSKRKGSEEWFEIKR